MTTHVASPGNGFHLITEDAGEVALIGRAALGLACKRSVLFASSVNFPHLYPVTNLSSLARALIDED